MVFYLFTLVIALKRRSSSVLNLEKENSSWVTVDGINVYEYYAFCEWITQINGLPSSF